VIGIAQLMIVLDVTVMNIALPSAQHALRFTTVDRQWVVTAYTLTFGSLLLVGRRLAEPARPPRPPSWSAWPGFAVVSAIGGASSASPCSSPPAGLPKGASAALLVPSALALLTTTFQPNPTTAPRRSHLRGVAPEAGGAIGLTDRRRADEYLSWR